jgi:hypothetical protein
MSTPHPPDDAQREMEQRALRNVRGLVDKMDAIEKIDRRTQMRLLAMIGVGALIAVSVIAAVVLFAPAQRTGTTITIEPAKPPR